METEIEETDYEKEINYERAYKMAKTKIENLKSDCHHWKTKYLDLELQTHKLTENFEEQIKIQVAIAIQKFHEDYILFVQSITKLVEAKK